MPDLVQFKSYAIISFLRVIEVNKVKKDQLAHQGGQEFLAALDSRDLRETEGHR